MCRVMSFTKARKFSFLATKSVSQFTSTSTATFAGKASHFCPGRDRRVAAGRDYLIKQFLQNYTDGTKRIVITRDRIVDEFGIGSGIDDRHRWNIETARFSDRVLLAGGVNHDKRIGQLRHFQNAVEVSAELGAFAIERR